MAFVQSWRKPQGSGSGQTLDWLREDFEAEDFSEGLELLLTVPAGYEVVEESLIVNYQEKLLVFGVDYTFDGTNVVIEFGDPESGPVLFQVQATLVET